MNTAEEKNLSVLFARLDDLCKTARRGMLGVSCFLSPRELHFAKRHLKEVGAAFFEWGGYSEAERKRIYVLPEYMEGVEIGDVSALEEYGLEHEDDITAVRIKGSGYKKLGHRDFLGSILGLGLQRSVIGDILTDDSTIPTATVICDKNAARFLCDIMTNVGTDTVTVSYAELSEISVPERKFAHISDTVASPRADCVVAALCALSREKARTVVVNGLLEIEHENCEHPDKTVVAPCVLSVRGYGKFRINSLSDKTKKGRLRLDADKYI